MRTRSLCLILLPAALAACYEKPPTEPDDASIALFLDTDIAPADGDTLLRVTVTTPPPPPRSARTFTLTTTLGTFPAGQGNTITLTPGAEGRAWAELRAPAQVGTAYLRLSGSGATYDDSVSFVTAPPSRIDVDATQFHLQAGVRNAVTVTATLRRASGRPTAGQRLRFEARLPDGTAFGQFSTPAPSSAEGIVTARFTAGDVSYRGPFTIHAVLESASTPVASAPLTLQLVE